MGRFLDKAVEHVKASYGEGSIFRFSDKPRNVEVISTGVLGIDLMTGVAGFPKGRIIELYGVNSSGKTTLALQTVAQAQSIGLNAAYIDVEHALDPAYSEHLGIKMEDIFISQPDSGEQALETAEMLLRSGELNIVVVDSVDALVPQSVIDGEMGAKHVADLARLMSQAMRKLAAVVSKSNSVFIFINQIRQANFISGYGPQETTSGGVALKFYAGMRIEMRPIGKLKDKNECHIGNRTRLKVVKNKVAPPFKEHELDLIFGQGFVTENDLLEVAIANKIVEVRGAYYYYPQADLKLGQGKTAALSFLKDNPGLIDEIRMTILSKE